MEQVIQTEFLCFTLAPHPNPLSLLNIAAAGIFNKSDQVIAGLKTFQWLPVSLRVKAKVL